MAIVERDDVIPVAILGEFILTSLAVLQFPRKKESLSRMLIHLWCNG